MSSKLYLVLSSLMFLGFLFITSCENTASEDFSESIEIFSDLEMVQGATNVTAVVNQGSRVGEANRYVVGADSWFQIQLQGIESNDFINNGTVGGWCLEWKKNMRSNNDVHEGNRIYSTKGADKWKPLNYFFSIKKELEREDPSLTYREFQAVIWSLAGDMGIAPEFDVTKLSVEELPNRLLDNGEVNFSKEKVLSILDRVRTEYASTNFKTTGSDGVVVMETEGDQQDVVIPDPPPVIEEDTNIYIYFDSSGSMNSTLFPLRTMRDQYLKDALLSFYNNDENEYNSRVNIIEYPFERTMSMLNILGQTEPSEGNVVVLVFQDEAHTIYHPNAFAFDPNATRSSFYETDITALRNRLDTFASTYGSNYYRGVIFQVEGFDGFKGLVQAVQNGTGSYTTPWGLSDRNEFNYVYDVIDGDTPIAYRDIVIQALQDLGFAIPTPL